ncbi:MAG: tRNA (adenosine(37)-N6)-threonylcarbamoyltransferase complex dimerization subunit type 1 TsaB [Chloroflexota bacterium]
MLLALDTATRKIGIALYDGVEILHEAVWQSPFHHTVELSPAIVESLTRAKHSIDDVEAIGLTLGPGSYTGLRIGAAVAKGLAFARKLPLVAVSTFEVIAAGQPLEQDTQLAAVIEAGRSRLGVGWFRAGEQNWEASKDPELLTPEQLSKKIRTPTVICGELNADLRKLLGRKRKNAVLASPASSLRRPAYLAELAWARWQAGETDDPATLAPIYLQTGANIPA